MPLPCQRIPLTGRGFGPSGCMEKRGRGVRLPSPFQVNVPALAGAYCNTPLLMPPMILNEENDMRRKKISIMIILVAIFALIFPAGAVAVPPPAPNRFHGTVTVNGTAAFDGTVIEARVGAEVRATTVGKR